MADLAFCGLSHLGLVSAVAAAAKGATVLAFDPDAALVAAIAAGRLPVHEPGLDAALAAHRGRLAFTADPAALAGCPLVTIAADVPTDAAGDSDLGPIAALVATVAPQLDAAATLVVLSQVPPGYTRALPARPGGLFCQVETLVFGQALQRALAPERIVVGCADPAAPLPDAYRRFLDRFGCPVLPMGYESAELAKIAINCLLVAQLSAANTLAGLCETVGADWGEIAPALRLDRRIGPHAYLAPGLGIAGGNLERDLATVRRLAAAAGSHDRVVAAWQDDSRHRRDWALRRLHATVLAGRPDARIGIWGLAYKPDTRSTRNSAALALIVALGATPMRCFDPVVALPPGLASGAAQAADPLDAARAADALAIMTAWPQFAGVDLAALAAIMSGRVLIDPYRIVDHAAAVAAGFEHHRLGAGQPRTRDRR
ncbi:MAG: UDP binding domain-containing protein [Alphaproteobacteria bacterium]